MRTPPAVVTIGVFDGVHRGHARVIGAARERAERAGSALVAMTFDVHPRVVLGSQPAVPLLTPGGEKAGLLRDAGAATVRVLRFTPNLARLTPLEFLAAHLFPWFRVSGVVVGYDFAMGRDRVGSVEHLARLGARHGFFVERVEPEMDGTRPVSSSRVRDALLEGNVEEGTRLLGRFYRMVGSVETGDGRGRGLGFPTANLRVDPAKVRPRAGVYAVRVHGADGGPHAGVLNLGLRPTFGGRRETVEVHLLDFEGDLRGRILQVEFRARIRDERRFSGPVELADQIERDVARGRAILASPEPSPPGRGGPPGIS